MGSRERKSAMAATVTLDGEVIGKLATAPGPLPVAFANEEAAGPVSRRAPEDASSS